MSQYIVFNKISGLEVYRYESDVPTPYLHMGFDVCDHILQPAQPSTVVQTPGAPTYQWFLDIGAFFDRFGQAKLNILTSADPVVKAIIQDVMVRKWVDLKRPDVQYGVTVIAAKVPELTFSLLNSILTTPVRPDENMALRLMYFPGE